MLSTVPVGPARATRRRKTRNAARRRRSDPASRPGRRSSRRRPPRARDVRERPGAGWDRRSSGSGRHAGPGPPWRNAPSGRPACRNSGRLSRALPARERRRKRGETGRSSGPQPPERRFAVRAQSPVSNGGFALIGPALYPTLRPPPGAGRNLHHGPERTERGVSRWRPVGSSDDHARGAAIELTLSSPPFCASHARARSAAPRSRPRPGRRHTLRGHRPGPERSPGAHRGPWPGGQARGLRAWAATGGPGAGRADRARSASDDGLSRGTRAP